MDETAPVLVELARECLAKAKNDPMAATNLLIKRLELFPELKASQLYRGCYSTITSALADERRIAQYGSQSRKCGPQTDPETKVRALAGANLMGYPLIDHSYLADGCRPIIRKSAEWAHGQSRDFAVKGQFLAMVADQLPNDTTPVRKVLSEKQLRDYMACALMGETDAVETKVA